LAKIKKGDIILTKPDSIYLCSRCHSCVVCVRDKLCEVTRVGWWGAEVRSLDWDITSCYLTFKEILPISKEELPLAKALFK
jgi:hypothetical protein